MDTDERWLEEIEKTNKSKMEEWIQDYAVQQKVKNMMSNTNYIKWLHGFTSDKESFYDDDWLYFPEKINDLDRENVYKLCLFYEGIDEYARENHIYPVVRDFGNFYKVRLNNFGFEIGVLIGQGTVFFCKKVPVEKISDFIDFRNIMAGKKEERTNQIDINLDYLSDTIISTYESGVPIESIINTVDKTIKEIISNQENKAKTLIKR